MRAQRRPGSAPAIQGTAERIPLEDASVDAAMAVLTDQHWRDRALGLAEMLRIARRRVVALTFDESPRAQFWLTRDYLTEYASLRSGRDPNLYELAVRGAAAIRAVPVPHDCADGFALAFWRRPAAYLDPAVRAGISVFHLLDPAHVRARWSGSPTISRAAPGPSGTAISSSWTSSISGFGSSSGRKPGTR